MAAFVPRKEAQWGQEYNPTSGTRVRMMVLAWKRFRTKDQQKRDEITSDAHVDNWLGYRVVDFQCVRAYSFCVVCRVHAKRTKSNRQKKENRFAIVVYLPGMVVCHVEN